MSDEKDTERESKDDEAIRALLKRASEASSTRPSPSLLGGVQRRIRARSRGKFYGDGWSTASTRVNYVLVAAVMLFVIAVFYLALGPMDVSAH